jgi:hypothetical protein
VRRQGRDRYVVDFPSLPGTADIGRIVRGRAPSSYATGLSAVTDLSFDKQGNLLVLEHSAGGLLAGGTPDAVVSVANTTYNRLNHPTGR